jgi:YHS domain-containing protein
MVKTCLIGAMAGVTMLSLSAVALQMHGEFDNACVTSLALEKVYKTDCSVNAVYKGKTLCFGNEKSREVFFKNPDEFLLRAQIFYSKQKQ